MADKVKRLLLLFGLNHRFFRQDEREETTRLFDELLEYFETPDAGAEEPDILCPFCDLRTRGYGDRCGWCHANLRGGI